MRLAQTFDEEDLALHQRHLLCQAPLDGRDSLHTNCLAGWARQLAMGRAVRLSYAPPTRPPRTHTELQALESYFSVLDGYFWLAQRFQESFTQVDKAVAYRETVSVACTWVHTSAAHPRSSWRPCMHSCVPIGRHRCHLFTAHRPPRPREVDKLGRVRSVPQ